MRQTRRRRCCLLVRERSTRTPVSAPLFHSSIQSYPLHILPSQTPLSRFGISCLPIGWPGAEKYKCFLTSSISSMRSLVDDRLWWCRDEDSLDTARRVAACESKTASASLMGGLLDWGTFSMRITRESHSPVGGPDWPYTALLVVVFGAHTAGWLSITPSPWTCTSLLLAVRHLQRLCRRGLARVSWRYGRSCTAAMVYFVLRLRYSDADWTKQRSDWQLKLWS
jgi:hypothetical protein